MLESVIAILSKIVEFFTSERFFFHFSIGSIVIMFWSFIYYLFKKVVIETLNENIKDTKPVKYMNEFWSKKLDELGLKSNSSNSIQWKKIIVFLVSVIGILIGICLLCDLIW